MKKLFAIILAVSTLLLLLTSAKKGEKEAAQQQAAQQHQTSAYQQDQIARKKAILNFKMAFVEGGSFEMGCTAEQADECLQPEKPAHPVFVHSFANCKYTVTQRQWREVMGKNPSDIRNDDLPVTNISWNDAQKFISKLNAFLGTKYRLPTEAEWEYAARGGTMANGLKYSGGSDIYYLAWYKDNSDDQTHPGGKRKENELGIFDMSGNVWEWCSDWYGPYPEDTETELINPEGAPSGTERVLRGGYFEGPALFCRTSCRNKSKPDYAASIFGLRLAMDKDGSDDNSNNSENNGEGE